MARFNELESPDIGHLEVYPRQPDFDVLRQGTTETISVKSINDEVHQVLAASRVDLTLFDLGGQSVLTGSYPPSGTITSPRDGIYQFQFDSEVYPSREHIAAFTFTFPDGTISRFNRLLLSLPIQVFRTIPYLRNQIDKAQKSVAGKLKVGYEDRHLALYLELGMHTINAVPPYTGFLVETFPFSAFGSLLIDAATIVALESQALFSVDTDVDYNFGGNSLAVDHFSKISSFLDALVSRFQLALKQFKQRFRTSGTVMAQQPISYGFGRFLQAVPAGFFSRFGLGVAPQAFIQPISVGTLR